MLDSTHYSVNDGLNLRYGYCIFDKMVEGAVPNI